MANKLHPKHHFHLRTTRATAANQHLAKLLEATEQPLITDYELFKIVQAVYRSGEKLHLRHDRASVGDFKRLRRQLRNLDMVSTDPNYSGHAHRILTNSDRSADEICCLVDPFCYISHLSAMQRYALTDRRPKALLVTVPGPQTGKKLVLEKMKRDHGEDVLLRLSEIIPLYLVHHPKEVRRRRIEQYRTNSMGEAIQIRGTLSRISTIGQTFLDTLNSPDRCGGMAHVVKVWRIHARVYLEEIIPVIDSAPTTITKIRAGYILTEVLNINDPRIVAWKRYATRGGSRLLDPGKPYAPAYSENWMISVNV